MKNIGILCIILLAGCSSIQEPACYNHKESNIIKQTEDNSGQLPPQYSGWAENYKLESSNSWAGMGWRQVYQGDLEEAMKSFNRSWEYNHNNYLTYWGWGVIIGRRISETDSGLPEEKYFKQSIDLLSKSLILAPKTEKPQISLDLANAYTGIAVLNKELNKLDDAQSYLNKSEKILKDYISLRKDSGIAYFLLASCFLYQGKNEKALINAQKAESLKFKLPDGFMKACKSSEGTTNSQKH